MSRVLELCEGLPLKSVPAGEALMTQGGTGHIMAVLKSGQVEVIKNNLQVAVIDEPGSIFGEMGFILHQPHSATVRALEDCNIFAIDDPEAFLWQRSEFIFEILRILAERVQNMTSYLAEMKHEAAAQSEAAAIIEKLMHDYRRQPEKTHSHEAM